jgi:hypothetical protein
MRGTIDFHYEFVNDIVIAMPRWNLETSCEVMHWYELHANYLRARFRGPKDLVTVNDNFKVALPVAALWESYRSQLFQTLVRHSVLVDSREPSRVMSHLDGAHIATGRGEVSTIEAAVSTILAAREAQGRRASAMMRASWPSTLRMPAVREDDKRLR